jgi:hypothetical protein
MTITEPAKRQTAIQTRLHGTHPDADHPPRPAHVHLARLGRRPHAGGSAGPAHGARGGVRVAGVDLAPATAIGPVVPVPPRIAPAFTVMGLPVWEPSTTRMPALTTVRAVRICARLRPLTSSRRKCASGHRRRSRGSARCSDVRRTQLASLPKLPDTFQSLQAAPADFPPALRPDALAPVAVAACLGYQ